MRTIASICDRVRWGQHPKTSSAPDSETPRSENTVLSEKYKACSITVHSRFLISLELVISLIYRLVIE